MKTLTTVVAVLVITSLAIGPMAATASHDDEPFFGIDSVENEGTVANSVAVATGLLDRVGSTLSALTSERTPADEAAVDAQEEFNENSDDWVAYVNERNLGSADHEVLEATFEVEDDSETVYLVAEYNDSAGEYDSAEVVDAETFDELDRDVDESVTLEGPAAENAADEISVFHDRFVVPDEDPTSSYLTHMSTKYANTDHVTGTLFGGEQ